MVGFFVSCQSVGEITTTEAQTTETPITTEVETTTESTRVEIDAIFSSYEDYEEEHFIYADVRIYFTYDYPNDLTTREEKRIYFEEKNQEYFENSGLEIAKADNVYMSRYSPFFGLTYKSKSDLFEDFNLLKQGYKDGYYGTVEVLLNTVGRFYMIDETSTLDSMIEMADLYFGTEITYDLIPFTLLANESTPSLGQNLTYDSLSDYINDYPDNPYDIDAGLFETDVLIVLSFGHSGSLSIEGIDSVFYLDDDTLEVAIKSTAGSTMMTTDYNPRIILLTIAKEDFVSGVEIRPHFHTHFLSGAYADRPYHNTVDQSDE